MVLGKSHEGPALASLGRSCSWVASTPVCHLLVVPPPTPPPAPHFRSPLSCSLSLNTASWPASQVTAQPFPAIRSPGQPKEDLQAIGLSLSVLSSGEWGLSPGSEAWEASGRTEGLGVPEQPRPNQAWRRRKRNGKAGTASGVPSVLPRVGEELASPHPAAVGSGMRGEDPRRPAPPPRPASRSPAARLPLRRRSGRPVAAEWRGARLSRRTRAGDGVSSVQRRPLALGRFLANSSSCLSSDLPHPPFWKTLQTDALLPKSRLPPPQPLPHSGLDLLGGSVLPRVC